MNTDVSIVSILIILSLAYFFIYELATFIRISNKKIKGRKSTHLLGALTTLLITVCVIFSTFGVNYDSSSFVIVTLILSVLFYISFAWQTLFKIKR